ncbi:host specificity protein J, partial [Escherichia coli FDA506]
ACGQ